LRYFWFENCASFSTFINRVPTTSLMNTGPVPTSHTRQQAHPIGYEQRGLIKARTDSSALASCSWRTLAQLQIRQRHQG
jgi:hypothetical protein